MVSIEDDWPWRITWHDGVGYTVSRPVNRYSRGIIKPTDKHPVSDSPITLCKTSDGINYEKLRRLDVDLDLVPSETTLRFRPDGTMLALVRCNKGNARFGSSPPPYDRWTWTDLGQKVGGPNMILLPNGRIIYCMREYRPKYPEKCWLGEIIDGKGVRFFPLPSGGDCSYAGMQLYEEKLWISDYSAH